MSNIGKISASSADGVSKTLSSLREASFAAYLVFDGIIFLKGLKVIDAKLFPNAAKFSAYLWATALGFSIAQEIKTVAQSRSQKFQKVSGKAQYDQVLEFDSLEKKSRRKLIWNLLDLLVALKGADAVQANEGVVAFAGVLSSLLGVQDVWASTA